MSFHRFPRKWVEFSAPVLWSSGFVVVAVLVIPAGAPFGTRRVIGAQLLEPAGKSAPHPQVAPTMEPDAVGARGAPDPSLGVPEPPKRPPLSEATASPRDREPSPVEGPEPSPTSDEVPPPPPGPSAHTEPPAPSESDPGTNDAAQLAVDSSTAQVDPPPVPSLVVSDPPMPSSGD